MLVDLQVSPIDALMLTPPIRIKNVDAPPSLTVRWAQREVPERS